MFMRIASAMKLLLITPDMARDLLGEYRTPTYGRTAAMEEALRNGQWDPELHRHRPLDLSARSGTGIANGTHRLTAIIRANIAAECWVRDDA